MGFFDTVSGQAEQGATQLATAWLSQIVQANLPKVQTAPAPAGTLPADIQSQVVSNSWIKYAAIGIAVIGGYFLLSGRKKKGGR